MLQAAEDYDVLQCFRVNDILAPECQNALHRYPLISRFTYDYRFRFTLCQALGDACGGRKEMLVNRTNLQGLALFNPNNVDPAIAAVPTILTTKGLASPSTGLPSSSGPAAAPNFGSSPLGNPGAPSAAGEPAGTAPNAPVPGPTASPGLGGTGTNSSSPRYSTASTTPHSSPVSSQSVNMAPPPPPPPPGAHGKFKSLNFATRSATIASDTRWQVGSRQFEGRHCPAPGWQALQASGELLRHRPDNDVNCNAKARHHNGQAPSYSSFEHQDQYAIGSHTGGDPRHDPEDRHRSKYTSTCGSNADHQN